MPAIRVQNLSKQYQVGLRARGYTTFREALASAAAAPLRRFRRLAGHEGNGDTFWALRDVSFDVEPGEVVGIIGRNGAGKSTLLKILSQITEPTEGRVELTGRVASLLEVGTGFHPELTGRENIFLNGAILGMSRREIQRKFDEIVDFAEIERFLDTPVKRYSSGMYVRLAFAVAAHLDPEILIVDEVLAVGDADFHRKCLAKMQDASTSGRTVLFVSHNVGAVRHLCSRALWLETGQLATDGGVADTVDAYLAQDKMSRQEIASRSFPDDPTKPVQLTRLTLRDSTGAPRANFRVTEPITVDLEFIIRRQRRNVVALTHILSSDHNVVLVSSELDRRNLLTGAPLVQNRDRDAATYRASVTIPAPMLNGGRFEVRVLLTEPPSRRALDSARGVWFEVDDTNSYIDALFLTRRHGYFSPLLEWSIQSAADE